MRTITTINTITNTTLNNQPIIAIHAEANKPAKALDDNQEQVQPIL